MEFNPLKPHFLASGGEQVFIHNLAKDISDPDAASFGDDNEEEVSSTITSVSWNRKVQHILASANDYSVI